MLSQLFEKNFLRGEFMEKISEKELVKRFGNTKQKEKYESQGKLTGSNKQNVLKSAQKYCTVTALENGMYKLTNQKAVAVTPDFPKTAKGIYSYTCPLIVQYVMKNEKSILGKISLASNIDMIADYYTSINYNPSLAADEFNLDRKAVYNYLENTTKLINYYIDETLKCLKKMQLVFYKTNYLVVKGKSKMIVDGAELNINSSIATEADLEIYKEAMREADVFAGTKNESERYYSTKSQDWSTKFYDILNSNGIMNVYPVYEVYTVHKDWCEEYRKQFADDDVLVKGLGKEFKQKIYDNMLKRIDKGKISEDDSDVFLIAYDFLSKICIGRPQLSQKTQAIVDNLIGVQIAKKYTLKVTEGNNGV